MIKVLREGFGPAVERAKDEMFVNYGGVEYTTGRPLYDTWDGGVPLRMLFEEAHRGWELGMNGMRVGGLRELIVPPRMAYKTDTLIYFIELIKVNPAAQ